MSDKDDVFGDAIFEAWRRGLNSDLVNPDQLDHSLGQGLSAEDCIAREINRISPPISEEEEDSEEFDV